MYLFLSYGPLIHQTCMVIFRWYIASSCLIFSFMTLSSKKFVYCLLGTRNGILDRGKRLYKKLSMHTLNSRLHRSRKLKLWNFMHYYIMTIFNNSQVANSQSTEKRSRHQKKNIRRDDLPGSSKFTLSPVEKRL